VFAVKDHKVQSRSPEPPPRAATGIKALQERVRAAANSYLDRGNAAIDQDWEEF
jgi:hypothetical protein